MGSSIFIFVDEIESTFVQNDIKMISEEYSRVCLFSVVKLEGKQYLPSNVYVYEEYLQWVDFNPLKILISECLSVLGVYFTECIRVGRILPFRKSVALLVSNLFKAAEIQKITKEIEGNKKCVYYSFWFYDCIYLAWLKKKGLASVAVSRAHSGDLYEDHISIKDKPLFRHFQLQYLDGVFPVSRTGSNYLAGRYKHYLNKIQVFYLGTGSHGNLNPINPGKLVLVSCASFRHHKRIHKIAESLLHLDIPITWYHFGSENLDLEDPKISEYIERKAELLLKNNITFFPMGYTENAILFEFYKSTPVNLFISLSAVEGLPVSIMEAISFGIPVLSTDVGGCSEIVNDQTGILIPLQTSTREISQIIANFQNSDMNTIAFRAKVRKFWEKNFNAETNYQTFFKCLSELGDVSQHSHK